MGRKKELWLLSRVTLDLYLTFLCLSLSFSLSYLYTYVVLPSHGRYSGAMGFTKFHKMCDVCYEL